MNRLNHGKRQRVSSSHGKDEGERRERNRISGLIWDYGARRGDIRFATPRVRNLPVRRARREETKYARRFDCIQVPTSGHSLQGRRR